MAAATPTTPDRLQHLSMRNPLLVGPLVWGVACVAVAAYRGPEVPLASPEILEEQLQRRLGNIPVPPDSSHYQQYKQYYIRQHEQHVEEYNNYTAQLKQSRSVFHWETLSQGLCYGFMIFGAMLAYCEYHHGTISFWMESVEERYCVMLENWRRRCEKSRKLAENKKMETLLREMGEGSPESTGKPSSKDRKRGDTGAAAASSDSSAAGTRRQKAAQPEAATPVASTSASAPSTVRQRKPAQAEKEAAVLSAADLGLAVPLPSPQVQGHTTLEAPDACECIKVIPQVRTAGSQRIPDGPATNARERLRRKVEEKRRQTVESLVLADADIAAPALFKSGAAEEAVSTNTGSALLLEAEELLCELEAAELLRQLEAENERKQTQAKKKAQRKAAERAAKNKASADSIRQPVGDLPECNGKEETLSDKPVEEEEDAKSSQNEEPEPEEQQRVEEPDAQEGSVELSEPAQREDSDDGTNTTCAPSGDERDSPTVGDSAASHSDEDASRSSSGAAEEATFGEASLQCSESTPNARAAWADIEDEEVEDEVLDTELRHLPGGEFRSRSSRTRQRRARAGRARRGSASEVALSAADAPRQKEQAAAPAAAASSSLAQGLAAAPQERSMPSTARAESWRERATKVQAPAPAPAPTQVPAQGSKAPPRPAPRAAPKSWAETVAAPSSEPGLEDGLEAYGILQELRESSKEQIQEWLQANGTSTASLPGSPSKEELLRLATDMLRETFLQQEAKEAKEAEMADTAQTDRASQLRAEAAEFVPAAPAMFLHQLDFAPEAAAPVMQTVIMVPIQLPEGAQLLTPGPDGTFNVPEGMQAQVIPIMPMAMSPQVEPHPMWP